MTAGTGTGLGYATAVEELWSGLAETLGRLDAIAADPDLLDDLDAPAVLRRLQYSLHLTGEHAYGLLPPPDAEPAHAELGSALASARDTTAEVADAVSVWGADGAATLLHEWRGALFRVRLAHLRPAISAPRPDSPPAPVESREERESVVRPLAAFLLALLGAVAFVAGATLALWPVWTAGSLAVVGSLVVYRP